MKYEIEIPIHCNKEQVIALYTNPDLLSKWQTDLTYYQTVNGEAVQSNAQAIIYQKYRNKQVIIQETVLQRKGSEDIHLRYEKSSAELTERHYFKVLTNNQTLWPVQYKFRFKPFGLRLFSWYFKPYFREHHLALMHSFRQFAETYGRAEN